MSNSLIGIDIGTSAVKAVLLDATGCRIADYAAAYPTRHPGPGLVEQSPGDWLALVQAALARFAAHPDQGRVQAIGFASQVNTHVFADAALQPLFPAIVWQDQRAAAAGAAIDAGISVAQKLNWLGAPIPVDASHVLARMRWMAAHHPAVWQQTRWVMAPKDWVTAQLTGKVVADPLASVGLVGPDLSYAESLIARFPGALARLPALVDPLEVAGVMAEGPMAGVPVVTGTMDAWASMFGLGVAEPGQAMYLSGSSEVLGVISPHRIPVPGVVTFPDWCGITLHAGPTQGGGASLDWLARLLGRSVGDLCGMAGRVDAGSPLFLPHLQGERAPIWDATARGVFAGLTGASGPEALAGAVMEGVAFSARWALEAVLASGDVPVPMIRAGGGGMRSDRWCQIRSDVLGRPLQRMQAYDAGAVGAAVMAGVGCGAMAGLVDAARRLVQPDRLFSPDRDAARLADRRFGLYRDLYAQMRPANAALTG